MPRGPDPPATHPCRKMKRKATAALAAMSMTASEAVRLLSHRIAVQQAFPLELKGSKSGKARRHSRCRRDGQDSGPAIPEGGQDVCGA